MNRNEEKLSDLKLSIFDSEPSQNYVFMRSLCMSNKNQNSLFRCSTRSMVVNHIIPAVIVIQYPIHAEDNVQTVNKYESVSNMASEMRMMQALIVMNESIFEFHACGIICNYPIFECYTIHINHNHAHRPTTRMPIHT